MSDKRDKIQMISSLLDKSFEFETATYMKK